MLAQPRLHLGFQVHCNTSDIDLGAVLTQSGDNEECVIAYGHCLMCHCMRALHGPELRYSTAEKEYFVVV